MKMTEILEKDKDRLLMELSGAAFADKAVHVLENELDSLLLKYNEQAGSDPERESAAYLVQAVRLSLPLMDSDGDIKVWERGEGRDEPGGVRLGFIILLLAGIVLCLFGIGPLFMQEFVSSETTAEQTELILHGGATLGGLIALYFAGFSFSRPKRRVKREHQVEVRIDAARVYSSFRTAILSVDQSLEEIAASERWKEKEKAGSIDGRTVTSSELELFSDLLAASYSGDAEYALEKIEAVKYFLHKQQIEVVDYSEETAKYFDLMPGSKKATIRPAMVAQGELLKKGMASAGR